MRVPKYRKNPDGRAFSQVNKKRYYFGRYGSADSKRRYKEFVADLVKEPTPPDTSSRIGMTVAELAAEYLPHAETYYSGSREFNNVSVAVRDFVYLHGERQARHLTPLDLLEYQRKLVAGEYVRTSVNARLARVRRWLKWCVSRQLLSTAVFQSLCSVEGLRAGRTTAIESPPVQPVSLEVVEKTLAHVAPVVATMARVQYLCGMRPDEVCRMRACDLDMTGEVWLYRPEAHKNTWRGQSLIKAIPAAAQKLLAAWIPVDPTAWIFTTRASVEWWATQVPRKSKVWPHELRARRKAAKRATHRRYTSATYGKAIRSGIERANARGANLPHWSPNQLRHTIAAELSRTIGQQAAQRWLGHARLDTTALYAGLHAAELVQIAKTLEEIAARAADGS